MVAKPNNAEKVLALSVRAYLRSAPTSHPSTPPPNPYPPYPTPYPYSSEHMSLPPGLLEIQAGVPQGAHNNDVLSPK